MNKIIDALKLAENTLEDIIRVYKFETGTPVTTLAAIREALADHIAASGKVIAEPVKRQTTYYGYCPICGREGVSRERGINGNDTCVIGHKYASSEAIPAEPVKQEPVAYVYEKDVAGIGMRKDVAFTKHVEVGTDLYAAPVSAKREWVDLTDDELKAALEVHQVGLSVRIGRIAIAAFKEKNNV